MDVLCPIFVPSCDHFRPELCPEQFHTIIRELNKKKMLCLFKTRKQTEFKLFHIKLWYLDTSSHSLAMHVFPKAQRGPK